MRRNLVRTAGSFVRYTLDMDFRVLGSFGGDSPDCRMTSFLIDGEVVVDAGAITRALTIGEQRKVRHVLISHTHMDHTATLPFLIENIFGTHPEPVSIYCAKRVMETTVTKRLGCWSWLAWWHQGDRRFPVPIPSISGTTVPPHPHDLRGGLHSARSTSRVAGCPLHEGGSSGRTVAHHRRGLVRPG